jgi:hypothetical protein
MPRRLVPDDQLSRALALRQSVNQAVLMAAAPLGGFLVARVGLPAIAWTDAVTFGISLCVLVAVKELSAPASGGGSAERARTSPRLDLVDGFRVVVQTPGLRVALLLTGAGAALILPVPSLLVPLIGRAAGWSPGSTGAVAGAVGAGVIVAALLAARRRASAPAAGVAGNAPGAAANGLALSGAGAFVLAAGPPLGGSAAAVVAVVGGLVFGFGNGTFVARLAPIVLGSAPRTHLARAQALVGLVQLVPVMVTNMVLGALAEHASPGLAVVATGAGLAACAAWARRAMARSA